MADGSGGIPPVMPRRPVIGSVVAAMRPLRHRMRQATEAIDRGRQGAQPDTARELVTIYDGGSIPTQGDRVFLGYVTAVDCDDSEGAIPAFAPDTSQTIPVVVLNAPASAGDLLVAHNVGGRWVAERGGPCKIKVCVAACGGLPVLGATITIIDARGNTVGNCTTDASGCCKFGLSAGTYTVQVSYGGYIVFLGTRTLACGGTTIIALGSNAGLVCCGGYAIPKKLKLTDGAGTIDFIYYPNGFFPIWFGGHSVQKTSCPVATPNNVCVVGPPSEGPVKVCYQMVCFAGQDPTFSIQRSWSWVYQQGTLTPIWYQDGSGITPGLPCVTSPPAICGSPLTDTAGCTANPSSTAPFALSCSPVAAAANSTVDPVGGGVAISA